MPNDRWIRAAGAPLLLVAACTSTALVQSWKDPAAGPLTAGRVLVIAISDNPSLRRAAEDELVRRIGPSRTVASYNVLSEADLKSADDARRTIDVGGFAYAVTLRPVSKSQELNWTPGTTMAPYGSFYGYYGWGWGGYYNPGYLRTDTILQVETQLFSIAEDKVIWAGLSKSTNPSSATTLVSEIAAAAAKDMQARGLLPAQ